MLNDPFGWNIVKSTAYYNDYTIRSRLNAHTHAVGLNVSCLFGNGKAADVHRDTKEYESYRANK